MTGPLDLDALREGYEAHRLCGVCLGLSPSWDGHDAHPACWGYVIEAVPSLLVLVGQLQEENRQLQVQLEEWQSTDAIEQGVNRRRDAELAAARVEVGQLQQQLDNVREQIAAQIETDAELRPPLTKWAMRDAAKIARG